MTNRFRALVGMLFLVFSTAMYAEDPTKNDTAKSRFEHRRGDKKKLLRQNGGTKESEKAVEGGLRWLALHQAADGRWSMQDFAKHARKGLDTKEYFDDGSTGAGSAKYDVAATAFGLLPFLASGTCHKHDPAVADNPYVLTVQRGIDWLLKKQGKDGGFPGGATTNMFEQALATIALCEAYGHSRDEALKKHAQFAIDFIVYAQDPKSGGWRYTPRSGGDTSIVGWQVLALTSGQKGGLTVPRETFKLAEKWLDSCESTDGGGYGDTGPQETYTMSAVGLLCRQCLGTPRRNPNLATGVKKLTKTPPSDTNNILYEYFATRVFFYMGGDYWYFWNEGPEEKPGVRLVLINRQDKDGSWDPKKDEFAAKGPLGGGRIMQTSLSLLSLQIYYLYLPMYQRIDPPKK